MNFIMLRQLLNLIPEEGPSAEPKQDNEEKPDPYTEALDILYKEHVETRHQPIVSEPSSEPQKLPTFVDTVTADPQQGARAN